MHRTRKRKLTVPFGWRDGRPWFPSEVPSGAACGCVCHECGAPLVARNREFDGRRRVRHFQHLSSSTCRGGVETMVHRMAKEILATAPEVILPAWSSGDIRIDAGSLLIVGAQTEAAVAGGAVRADVQINGVAGSTHFQGLCVEVRVHHAVDDAKRTRLADEGIDAFEIDLSDLDDASLADPLAFRHAVLADPANRRWINLTAASYVADGAGRALFEITDTHITERVITTKAGRPFPIREQGAYLVKPGSREPVRLQIPDETVCEEAVPYGKGIHTISARSITVDGAPAASIQDLPGPGRDGSAEPRGRARRPVRVAAVRWHTRLPRTTKAVGRCSGALGRRDAPPGHNLEYRESEEPV